VSIREIEEATKGLRYNSRVKIIKVFDLLTFRKIRKYCIDFYVGLAGGVAVFSDWCTMCE
jgi:hypothetical protein